MTRSTVLIQPRQPSRRRRGFTLTEVLLVLAILGVIAAMVVPNLLGRQKEALIRSTKMSIKSMEDACTQYAIAHDGEYPQMGAQEMINLLMNPGQDSEGKPISPYLPKTPLDAWNKPLFYEFPNNKVQNATKPAIWSSGPNKINDEGSNDDVNNWTEAAG